MVDIGLDERILNKSGSSRKLHSGEDLFVPLWNMDSFIAATETFFSIIKKIGDVVKTISGEDNLSLEALFQILNVLNDELTHESLLNLVRLCKEDCDKIIYITLLPRYGEEKVNVLLHNSVEESGLSFTDYLGILSTILEDNLMSEDLQKLKKKFTQSFSTWTAAQKTDEST